MLQTAREKHNLVLEPRIYLQLVQCCIRERQGTRAIEVYKMLSTRCLPTQAMHNSMLSMCCKLQMFDTAAEILQLAAARGASVSSADSKTVIEGAFRKNKWPIV